MKVGGEGQGGRVGVTKGEEVEEVRRKSWREGEGRVAPGNVSHVLHGGKRSGCVSIRSQQACDLLDLS